MSSPNTSHAPTRISAGVAVGATGIAGTLGLGGTGWWVLLSPLGIVLVTTGLWRRTRWIVAFGCTCLFGAVFVTGLTGGAPARMVVAVAAALVAWDTGEYAITLGDQLGRQATTWRLEFFHTAAAVVMATVGVGIVYVIFVLARGGQPLIALVFLLVGVLALLLALRSE